MNRSFGRWWERRLPRLRWTSDTTYIVPTPTGFLLLGGALSVFLLAALYRNDTLYVHGFALLSLFFLGMILTHGNLRRVRVSEAPLPDPFPGTAFAFPVTVENTTNAGCALLHVRVVPGARVTPRRRFFVLGSSRRAALRAALAQNVLDSQEREQRRSREARALLGDTLPQIEITYLEKNRSTVVRPVLQAISRGRFPDAAAFVTTRAPLGLFVAWRVFPLRCDACVLPEPRGPFCVPWGGGGGEEDDEEEGREAAKARTRGAGQEVEGLHPLRSGDAITRVAWRRFMPHRIPLVRSMTPDTRRHVRLTWDAAARAGDFEATLSQLAVWVLSCRTQGVSFDVDTPAWRGSELRDADCDAALRAFALFPSPTARTLDADIAP